MDQDTLLDVQVTGSNQVYLSDMLQKYNDYFGVGFPEDWNTTGSASKFNVSNGSSVPFVGLLAGRGLEGSDLQVLLHALSQYAGEATDDTSITTGTLVEAEDPRTVPMGAQSLSILNAANIYMITGSGNSVRFETGQVIVESPVSNVAGKLSIRDGQGASTKAVSFTTVSDLTTDYNLTFGDLGAGGFITVTAGGAINYQDLQVSNLGSGQTLHDGFIANDLAMRTISSPDSSVDIVQAGDGSIEVKAVAAFGRGRGAYAFAKNTTQVWPTINSGTNLVGQPFNADDKFTVNVTDDTGSDTYDIDDGVDPPVSVKTGDQLVLLDPLNPTLTASWIVKGTVAPVNDSNMVTQNLTNTTGGSLAHDIGGHSFSLSNVAIFQVTGTSHNLVVGGGSGLEVMSDRSVKCAGYTGGTKDATAARLLAVDTDGKVVTNPVVPTGYIIHEMQVTGANITALDSIELDGSHANTSIIRDGSLDWSLWPSQESLATDGNVRVTVDGRECDLTVISGQLSMLRDSATAVSFTQQLNAGAAIKFVIPIYTA